MNRRPIANMLRSDWKKAYQVDAMLVCGDADRSFLYNNLYYSPLIDSVGDLIERLGYSCISFSDRLASRLGDKAFRSPHNINRHILFNTILKKVGIRLGVSVDKVHRFVINREAKLWLRVLQLVKPKLVIAIQPTTALCLAGKRLNIPVYDLQHGIISDTIDNPYYYSARSDAISGDVLPQGFLCWDEASKKSLAENPLFKGRPNYAVGNPWFARFVDNSNEDQLVQDERTKLISNHNGKPVILVTLQYDMQSFAADYISDGMICEQLKEVIKSTGDKYVWLLRLHPSQMVGTEKSKVERYLQNHFGHLNYVHWNQCSLAPMPLVMSLADLHVTHFSSAVIEAASFAIHTALLDPHICKGGKHEDFYRAEINKGLAEVVELNVHAIERFLEQKLSKSDAKVQPSYCNKMLKLFLEEKLGN